MPSSGVKSGLWALAVAALVIFGWSLYRDYCADKMAPAPLVALQARLDSADTATARLADSVARVTAALDRTRSAYAADRRKDAAHDQTDAGVRDSLSGVVAGAIRQAQDSAATVAMVRRDLATVDSAWRVRAATDSGALVRLTGRLSQADSLIAAQAEGLRLAAVTLDVARKDTGIARALAKGWQAEASRQARQRRWWMLGAGAVAVVAVVR